MRALCLVSITIALFVFDQSCFAQTEVKQLCGIAEQREKLLREHPEIIQQEQHYEEYTRAWIRNYKQQSNAEKSATGRIIIPLVFHIINEGGAPNISDAQVVDEVRILNRDYNKKNADTADAVSDFKYIVANMGVEFRLATIDPKGNCTNGIERITSDQVWVGDDYSKLNTWPRDQYLNVWVVAHLGGNAAGYAYYPTSVAALYNAPNMDGVIILSSYIGSIGTGSDFTSRALTHEIGHVFNLKHPWGDTNSPEVSCGDDDVDDTPLTKGWLYCPTPVQSELCTPGVIENYQNYMDYSYCSIMFTEGQKARWLAAANSGLAGRSTLWSDANLIATGTYDTLPSPCAPIAGFASNLKYVCAGNQVKFYNTSGNGKITSSLWHFPAGTTTTTGASAVSDTVTNPTVIFNSIGWQTVTLTVANNLGSSTLSDSMQVYVTQPTATINAPYYQGFEDPNVFNENGWASISYDNGNPYNNNITRFSQTNRTSHTGNGCVMLNNYRAHANYDINQIVSPAINLSQVSTSNLKLSFYYSFATANQYVSYIDDSIVVYYSTNCGTSWNAMTTSIKLGSTSPNVVVNAGYVPTEFTPTSPSYWKQVVCNIPAGIPLTNVHFMIQGYTTIQGNNLYIDDINIGNAAVSTDVEKLSSLSNVELFPNPGNGAASLKMQLEQSGKVSVKVYDMAGQAVINCFDSWMNNGENEVAIQGYAHLSHGIYIVTIVAGESVVQKKLIVQ